MIDHLKRLYVKKSYLGFFLIFFYIDFVFRYLNVKYFGYEDFYKDSKKNFSCSNVFDKLFFEQMKEDQLFYNKIHCSSDLFLKVIF